MPLLSPNHSPKTGVSSEALTSTTIFEVCGVKPSSGRQARYILKTHLELPYLYTLFKIICSRKFLTVAAIKLEGDNVTVIMLR